MEVIPSIDLKDGRCVRLYQGDYHRETVYSDEPVAMARSWEEQGAARLHLVDLDGALEGSPANFEAISAIIRLLSIPVQVGGGVRDSDSAGRVLNAGAARVVIGTAAVEDPSLVESLCREYGSDRVVVALDARDGLVSTRGWLEQTSVTAGDLARQMAGLGVVRVLYTDISRDGTMTEPNFAANEELVKSSGMAVLASGGIASLDHIRRLAAAGVEGGIVGRAFYDGTLGLQEAMRAGAESPGAEASINPGP
jgi:phosphoribosylformimino-5-aminoimidazole carboxamide ribotide isomerase